MHPVSILIEFITNTSTLVFPMDCGSYLSISWIYFDNADRFWYKTRYILSVQLSQQYVGLTVWECVPLSDLVAQLIILNLLLLIVCRFTCQNNWLENQILQDIYVKPIIWCHYIKKAVSPISIMQTRFKRKCRNKGT